MAPPEGGIHVLDGSGIREGLANGNVVAKERFVQSDEGGKGHLTTAELRRAAEAEAAALLLGARIQSQILDRAFDTVVVDQGSEQQVDEQAFASVLENYLLAIADSLDGEKIFSFSLLFVLFFFFFGNLVVVVCATVGFRVFVVSAMTYFGVLRVGRSSLQVNPSFFSFDFSERIPLIFVNGCCEQMSLCWCLCWTGPPLRC